MKKANNIKNVEVRENGSIRVTYMNGLTRTFKKMTKAAMLWLRQNNDSEPEEHTSWVFAYLAKPGKSLYTLESAIRRMTKEEIVFEKFAEFDWGLCIGHTKNELVSIILDELLGLGYQYPSTEPTKRAKKARKPSNKEIRTGLEYIIILNDPRMSDSEKLAALGYIPEMDPGQWYDMISIPGVAAVRAYGYEPDQLSELDRLFGIVINSAA